VSVEPASYLERLFGLHGRSALVTGASGGIGRAIAVGLAAAGATVGLHGRRQEQLRETQLRVESVGGKSVLLPAELDDDQACRRLIDEAYAAFGNRLDILVNNAGMNRRKPVAQVPPEDLTAIVNVNLRAPYVLSQAAHPLMRRQGGGKVIHVASLTTFIGLGGTSVYGMTKAAIAQLAKTQAVEWAKDKIQVNCLAPGFILTPLTETSLWQDPAKKAWLLGRIPARRPGAPEDMVAAVIYMASAGSAYLTGQTIAVEGGVLAGGSWDD